VVDGEEYALDCLIFDDGFEVAPTTRTASG
jgi:hypothetical protein